MSTGGGSQTQRTEPPRYQLPYLQDSLRSSQTLYNSTLGTPNMGVAQRSPETLAAQQGIASLAGGNQLTQNQQNLANQTLSGGFLGSNPYLDDTFNRAALATQNQLASQFGGAGRNVEASEGLRSQQLNDLATSIYGGAYDAERNRQQQVLGMSPQLQAGGYYDLGQLANVGAAQEGYYQQLLDQPGNLLDQYINRVSGNMGTTIKTSGGGDNGAGILGGLGLLGSFLTLSDIREKTDIEHLGFMPNGLGIYGFRYKTGVDRHIGLMAQEVEQVYPDCVIHDEIGRKHVLYDRVFDHMASEGGRQ